MEPYRLFGIRVSPITYRRWVIFRQNRRAFYASIGLLLVFIVSMSAPILANDRPLFIRYEGQTYFPVFKNYSGQDFGLRLPGLDYKSQRFAALLNRAGGWALWPPLRWRYDTQDTNLNTKPSGPEWGARVWARLIVARDGVSSGDQAVLGLPLKIPGLRGVRGEEYFQENVAKARAILDQPFTRADIRHWMGTDDTGRDIIARFLWGLYTAFAFGICFVAATSVLGISLGAIQGYYGGWVDILIQRFLEVYASIPVLYIVIALVVIFGSSFWLLLTVLVVFNWTSFEGVTRVEFLRARNMDYVRAARALGVRDGKIMRRHILPNAFIGPITMLPFAFAGSIGILTGLDYLGFGLPRSWPSLGEMGAQASRYYYNWWQVVGVGVPSALLTLLFVFVGDGIRQAFDPRAIYTFKSSTPDKSGQRG